MKSINFFFAEIKVKPHHYNDFAQKCVTELANVTGVLPVIIIKQTKNEKEVFLKTQHVYNEINVRIFSTNKM